MNDLMMKMADKMSLDMITNENHREIAEIIGIRNFIRMCSLLGGLKFYIPKCDHLLTPLRNQMILEEYNGYNVRHLARKYNISVTWVSKIVEQSKDKKGR